MNLASLGVERLLIFPVHMTPLKTVALNVHWESVTFLYTFSCQEEEIYAENSVRVQGDYQRHV